MAENTYNEAFLVLHNYDFSEDSVWEFPDLSGNIMELKKLVMLDHNFGFDAFNTTGKVKAWFPRDMSQLKQSNNCSVYLRVQFPDWVFLSGQNSPDTQDDIRNIQPELVSDMLRNPPDGEFIAAITTQGRLKRKVNLPLETVSDLNPPNPMHGIYIRTGFPDFQFFKEKDSPGNDILMDNRIALRDDIPSLVQTVTALQDGAGFTSQGQIKSGINFPLQDARFDTTPWSGIYIRTCWPDFVFLPGLDSEGNNISQRNERQTWQLISAARRNDAVVAFNTDGWMKDALASTPTEIDGQTNKLSGLYIKKSAIIWEDEPRWQRITHETNIHRVDYRNAAKTMIFLNQAAGITFCKVAIPSAELRQEYITRIRAMSEELLNSSLFQENPEAAAFRACAQRNSIMTEIRMRTPQVSRLFAENMKANGPDASSLLYKNFCKIMRASNNGERLWTEAIGSLREKFPLAWNEAARMVVESAGRSNVAVNVLIKGMAWASGGLMICGLGSSIYSVVTADHWGEELTRQVQSWAWAIGLGEVCGAIGAALITGPWGALVGGILGSICGAIGGHYFAEGQIKIFKALKNHFCGGVSDRSASDLLQGHLDSLTEHVRTIINQSRARYYVHCVLEEHLHPHVNDAPRKMVETPSTHRSSGEPAATLIWLYRDNNTLIPINPANPRDLYQLICHGIPPHPDSLQQNPENP